MKNLLFVHSSSDLYGSDKALLLFLLKINRKKFHPIVLLPARGPLFDELKKNDIECYVTNISKITRASYSLTGILGLLRDLTISFKSFNKIVKGKRVDLVHSNTLAVVSGALWAWLYKIPHVWHVHEIIVRPIIARKMYAALLWLFSNIVVCNSKATKNNLLMDMPFLRNKIVIVWNGVPQASPVGKTAVAQYKKQIDINDGSIVVALVGRVNRLKGQRILVQSAEILWNRGYTNIKFLIVGDAPTGQEHFAETLKAEISNCQAKENIILQTFMRDTSLVWETCDIVVVPSTEPESFGLVVVEAMAAAKPVIATNHGGVIEIVQDGETGLLIPPGDSQALANAIKQLIENPLLREKMGKAGEIRYRSEFTLDKYVQNIEKVYDLML